MYSYSKLPLTVDVSEHVSSFDSEDITYLYSVLDSTGFSVAQFFVRDYNLDQAESNARLFSVAPAMVEQLLVVASFLRCTNQCPGIVSNIDSILRKIEL